MDFSTQNLEPILNQSNQQLNVSSRYVGLRVIPKNSSGITIASDSSVWTYGPKLDGWDENVNLYRTYTSASEEWRNIHRYFRTPKKPSYVTVSAYSVPKSKAYFDNIFIKEVPGNYDPSLPDFKKSGTLNFIKYHLLVSLLVEEGCIYTRLKGLRCLKKLKMKE